MMRIASTVFAVLLSFVAALTVNGQGQYRTNAYRQSDFVYRYPWQTRHNPVLFVPRQRYNGPSHEDDNGNRLYHERRQAPPSPKRDGFSLKETSYGSDPLAELDPHTRRVVENSYHLHGDNNYDQERRHHRVQQANERSEQYSQETEERSRAETDASREDDCAMMKVGLKFNLYDKYKLMAH